MTITSTPAPSDIILSPSKRLARIKKETLLAEFTVLVSSHAIGKLVVTNPLPEYTTARGRLIFTCWRRLRNERSLLSRASLPIVPPNDIVRSIELTFRDHYADMFDFAETILRCHFDFDFSTYPLLDTPDNGLLASRLLEGYRYAHSIDSATGAVQRFQHPLIYDIIERCWFFCPIDPDTTDQTLHNMPSVYFKDEAFETIPLRTVALILTVIEITMVTQYLGNRDDPVDILLGDEGQDKFSNHLKALKMHETATARSGESPNFATVRAQWYTKAAAAIDPLTMETL